MPKFRWKQGPILPPAKPHVQVSTLKGCSIRETCVQEHCERRGYLGWDGRRSYHSSVPLRISSWLPTGPGNGAPPHCAATTSHAATVRSHTPQNHVVQIDTTTPTEATNAPLLLPTVAFPRKTQQPPQTSQLQAPPATTALAWRTHEFKSPHPGVMADTNYNTNIPRRWHRALFHLLTTRAGFN